MQRLTLILWALGAVVGLTAEWAAFGWGAPRDWIPDLVTGWTMIGCGLVALSHRPKSRTGALMTMTGFAWFAANYATVGPAALGWLAAQALYLHRGPLLQLVLEYPRGRGSRRLDLLGVGVAYVAAIVTPLWRSPAGTIALAIFFVAIAAVGYAQARGRRRRERRAALEATTFLCVILAVDAAARLAFPTAAVQETTRLVYEGGVCVLAVVLLVRLLREPWKRAAVDELVAGLGDQPAAPVRDALARALGDPSLEIGYWLSDKAGYVDSAGRQLALPSAGAYRRVTPVEREGRPIAVLVHDPAVLDDPGLAEAVAAATRLSAANARLQAEVQSRLVELRQSRLRLVAVADDERRRLEERLRGGAERRLASLLGAFGAAHGLDMAAPGTAKEVERAEARLARAVEELAELAAGLHPHALAEAGLAGALASLAERSPVPVAVSLDGVELPADVEAAAYFVCSEALANIAKHASASSAIVDISADERLVRLVVTDDGRGGADPNRGTGIRGLADRIDALGGSLAIDTRPGRGTRLTVTIPLETRS